MSSEPLLTVEGLEVRFSGERGTVHAVEGVSFDVNAGETVCLVGESGSGKTITCESVTKLAAADETNGSAQFDGRDLLELSAGDLREYRGNRIAYVFQNPQNALDPVYTVRQQLVESIREHRDISRSAASQRAIGLLDDVGIPNPANRADEYPDAFSGGMRQRVLIAMALAGDPDLLIADEPTTALDVTTEADILELFARLQRERGMATLFVTHDLAVVSEIADRIVVMYGGKVMERGSAASVLERPSHPYTRALLRCLPGRGGQMEPIGGAPPDATDPPEGCRFHPRCPHAVEACRTGGQPPEHRVAGDAERVASCVYHADGYDADTVLGPLFADGESDPAADASRETDGSAPSPGRETTDSTHDAAGRTDDAGGRTDDAAGRTGDAGEKTGGTSGGTDGTGGKIGDAGGRTGDPGDASRTDGHESASEGGEQDE